MLKWVRRNRRALMGIGTLIIFIATILVAAVAAGVLISTSNVLQQRALLTGQEVRKRVTNSIQVISILAGGNSTSEEINDFEILIRLEAGSDPVQMKKFDIQWISPQHDAAASLQDPELDTTFITIGLVSNNSYTNFGDLDDDGRTDSVTIITPYSSTCCGWNSTDDDALQFNISGYGISDPVDLGYDLSTGSNVTFSPPTYEEAIVTSDGHVLGFVTVDGYSGTTANQLDASANITIKRFPDICDFDHVIPEDYYCVEVMHGNTDTVLDSGERFKLIYKVLPANVLGINEEFQFIFTAEKGRLSEVRARTPDVIVTRKVSLWPLG